MLDQHSARHTHDEDDSPVHGASRGDEARPRAEPPQAPAHAEQAGADHESPIDVPSRRKVELDVKDRRCPSPDDSVGDEAHGQRRRHDETQARVPRAGDVEKTGHLRWLGHSGNGQTDGK